LDLLEELRASRFPKLVISGGHSPRFEADCDALAEHMRARRAVIGGPATRSRPPGSRTTPACMSS
jgi:hypothetical protein